VLVNGTVGAGKTSVAAAIGDLLSEAGVAHAVLDVDSLRRSWPCPPGDRFNSVMALRNVSAVAGNYREAGAVRLVLAGVVESRAERDDYRAAVGVPLTVCRLHVELPTVLERLGRRHGDDSEALRWHLRRAGELDGILRRAGSEDVVVDATATSVRETAAAVVAAIGW
jgi:adenylylsulfate kinase